MGSSNIPHEARQAIQRLVGDAKPQVDRPPTLVLAIDQAEELFAIGEGQEVVLLRQHLTSALLCGGTSAAAATPGEQDRTRLLGYRTVPSPSSCFNGAITSPSPA
jgi:hypothetical protein